MEDDLKREIERLGAELKAEREKSSLLEEECDGLALANHTLSSELALLKTRLSVYEREGNVLKEKEGASSSGLKPAFDVIIEGSNNYVKEIERKIVNAAGGMNVLCVCFCSSSLDREFELIVCGGADKSVRGFNVKTGELLFHTSLTAPVLCLASSSSSSSSTAPFTIAASCMDGSIHLIHSTDFNSPTSLTSHGKYATSVCWSLDGNLIASASHDKTVHLYTFR